MEEVTIVERNGIWIAKCSYEQRGIPKSAGFRWDGINKCWYTRDAEVAARLQNPGEWQAKREAALASSRAVDAEVELPVPDGLLYLPYQRAGIAFALAHPNVLFGDEMGLGKTIQAIGTINADASLKKILVICPASLKLNWKRELERWLVRKMSIALAAGSFCRPEAVDITIINYDIVEKHEAKLQGIAWDAIIIDEMHYCKNPKAKRTIAIVGKRGKKGEPDKPGLRARRRIGLTGTPIPNRPIEGQPIFGYLAPAEFGNFFGFAKRYANAHYNGYGWDFGGASNLEELQERLRSTIMVRRLKKDVLTELPAKRRAVVELAANGASHAIEAERDAWERNEEVMIALRAALELAKASDRREDYEDAVNDLKAAASRAFTEMAQARHDTAVAKIPYVIEHVRNVIDQGQKVVVFAHHHDVLEALAQEFGRAAVLVYGKTPMADRQLAVDRFQGDPECLVFLGGIQAAGVGLTLTAASHVVFAELDWVPGNVTQAEDRCHRIGQRDMVLVEHLVLEGSLDARMARILVDKQAVIDAALDTEFSIEPVTPALERERAATESLSRKKVEDMAIAMAPDQIAAIHRGLQILADMDLDRARELNGIGFSKIDCQIGHSLAQAARLSPKQAVLGRKLVNKYRRQLPEELVAAAKGDK